MKLLPFGLVLLASTLSGHGRQDQKDTPAAQAGGLNFPKPGPEHALLQTLCGDWDAVVHVRGQTAKASMTTRAQGAFFTIDDYTGDYMGQPFANHGINGYDPNKKQFFSVWTDSWLPVPMFLWGTYDEKKKELTMSGEGCGMDGKPRKASVTKTWKDADHWEFVLTDPGPGGKPGAMVRIEYSRRKK